MGGALILTRASWTGPSVEILTLYCAGKRQMVSVALLQRFSPGRHPEYLMEAGLGIDILYLPSDFHK
jgi:hypothetical protein